MRIGTLLTEYLAMHKKFFHRKPAYIRPFLARSDPALLSGIVANVLANKIALSEAYAFGKKHGVGVFPIIGAGSLVFRGGLSPARCKKFVAEYGGCLCKEVQTKTMGRSFNLWDPDDYAAFDAAGGHADKCPDVVGKAAPSDLIVPPYRFVSAKVLASIAVDTPSASSSVSR